MQARYLVPDYKIAALHDRIKKLDKRAKRLGLNWITFQVVGEKVEEVRHNGKKVKVLLHDVEISGEAPKLEGWTFVATLDHTVVDTSGTKAGAVVRTVPGETLPEQYRCSDATCDHCNVARYRKETFVVRHENGTLKRIGRQCLRDFLGHVDPHQTAMRAQLLGDLHEEMNSAANTDDYFGGAPVYYVEEYLGFVAAQIRECGWVSGGEAYQNRTTSTATRASMNMIGRLAGKPQADEPKPNDADRKLATDALEWVRGIRAEGRDDLSEYMHNLTVVCSSDILGPKNHGLVGSLISTYKTVREREIAREIERKHAQRFRETSTYVGTVKERLTLDITVLNNITKENKFHELMTIITMTDGTNLFTWFPTTSADEFVQGASFRVKGTVKRHVTFNGIQTTYLSRVAPFTDKKAA